MTVAFKSKATEINESNLISFSQTYWGCKLTNPAECTNKLNLGFCTEKRDDPGFNQRYITHRFLAQVKLVFTGLHLQKPHSFETAVTQKVSLCFCWMRDWITTFTKLL